MIESQDYSDAIVQTVREPLLVLDGELRVKLASPSFHRHFHVTPQETVGRLIYELGNGQWNIPALKKLLEELLPQNHHFDDFSVEHHFPGIGRRIMLLNARRLVRDGPPGEKAQLILLAFEDITERRLVEQVMRDSEERYRTLFDLGPVAVYFCDALGVVLNFNRRAAELWGRTPVKGDTDEKFCGSHEMYRPDGTFMPHNKCPMVGVLSGAIESSKVRGGITNSLNYPSS